MKAPFPSPVAEWRNDTYPAIDPTRPELSQKGKKIVVTGGGAGIGKGTVEAFAQAGAASIAITGRRLEKLVETKKYIESKYTDTSVYVHAADVTDAEAMKKAAKEIGTWDVLVMNAGYLSTTESIQTSELNEWWKAFEINIKGVFITAQAFLPAHNEKAVVIATSTGASLLPAAMVTTSSSYVTSKMGLNKFIEVLAAENTDIRFHTIHPGVIETEMSEKSKMKDLPRDTIELPSHYTVWIASPEAAYLKGKFSWCNWDVDELKIKAKEIEESNIFTTNVEGWPFST